MATTSSLSLTARRSLVRPIVLGGLIIGIVQFVLQEWIVFSVLQQNPLMAVLQYITSGILGNAAFEGGIATALIGVLIHFFISLVIAGVFILSAERIPLLRRHAIAGALLYGIGVFIVMNMIVIPLSAAPAIPPPTLPWLIEIVLDHMLVVGLPLGILVRRNVNTNR
jgi:uncharacterized membrane protein YagU involved in acid resistance